jgi:hypothetical protein
MEKEYSSTKWIPVSVAGDDEEEDDDDEEE